MKNLTLRPGALTRALLATTLLAATGSAMATNGYFSHGYGMKAKGMGGASVAMTDNAFAGANNPAVAAWAGDRAEIGLDLFMPKRGMERTGGTTLGAVAVDSDSTQFLVPEFGLNRAVSDTIGMGLTVYGNGGLNTDYAGGQINCGAGAANVLCGTGRLGIDMSQLIVAPTFAYKFAPNQSVGVSALLVQQTFKADGLQGFTAMSNSAANLTNNGVDTSTGFGLRLGYLGRLSEALSVGVSYSPKVRMTKLTKYSGLFAEDGGFDIPDNLVLGAAIQTSPTSVLAFDYARIRYSGVASVGNPSSNTGKLGTDDGRGFGWGDISVFKIGYQWQATKQLQMRLGLNIGENPVKNADVTFNILAPGVVTNHFTLGGTYALSDKSEITFSYMYAPSNSNTGASLYNALGSPAGDETVRMNQQSIGIQYGWKF